MSDNGEVLLIRLQNQIANGGNPRQRIIDAHGSAHETKAGKRFRALGERIVSVNGNQLPWDTMRFKKYGKIARTFCGGVTENGNGIHEGAVENGTF